MVVHVKLSAHRPSWQTQLAKKKKKNYVVLCTRYARAADYYDGEYSKDC